MALTNVLRGPRAINTKLTKDTKTALTWRPPAAARRCVGASDRQDLSALNNGLVGSLARTHRSPAKPGQPGQRVSADPLQTCRVFLRVLRELRGQLRHVPRLFELRAASFAPASVLVFVALLALAAAPAYAQGERYAVLVQGASGEEQYATLHREWIDTAAKLLIDRFKIDKANVALLTEQPRAGEERATAENVKAVLGRLAKQIKPGDLLFVLLIGHGGGQGADSKFNLIGPDLSVAEWAALLQPIQGRIAVVDSTSSSFAYLEGLKGPGRVVITATNSYSQRFHTVFPDAFLKSLTATDADVDKNGRISLLEAFTHASRLVTQHYEQTGHMATEKAVFDDTGDGVGRDATAKGPDGTIA